MSKPYPTKHIVVVSHVYCCGDDDHVSAVLDAHFIGIEHVIADHHGMLVGGETRIIPVGSEHPLTVAHREGFTDGYRKRVESESEPPQPAPAGGVGDDGAVGLAEGSGGSARDRPSHDPGAPV